jgi:hypothetical protein
VHPKSSLFYVDIESSNAGMIWNSVSHGDGFGLFPGGAL